MKHTLSALLRDHPGALNRAVSLFRRRGFNIDSLHVAGAGTAGISRMTLVVDADDIQKIVKQLDRLIDVLQVEVVPSNGE
ncbi:MAG: acetolactate synthase small subunit [Gemmatimonadota bacterium]